MTRKNLSLTNYTTESLPPVELVRVPPPPAGQEPLPEALAQRVAVDVIHDGGAIPEHLLAVPAVEKLVRSGELWRHYVAERDWGAGLVAGHLASALGLGGYTRVNLARVVMDFNRFPGISPPRADYFGRLAISPPLSDALPYELKREILERYYDRISSFLERVIQSSVLKLAIHTYDVHNLSATRRPEVSVLTRSHSYQQNSHLPFGLFDPLFPDELVASSADPILRERVCLTVEKLGTRVEQNYPYSFPDGSVEIRAQVWLYFQYLRRKFLEAFPDRRGRPAYERVWEMLLNTGHRNAESEVLFGYLHRYRRPSHGAGAEMAASRRAYEEIREFAHERRVAGRYWRSPHRVDILAVEVRKDLLWRFAGDKPVEPDEGSAQAVAHKLAEGIRTYFRHDRRGAEGAAAGTVRSVPPALG